MASHIKFIVLPLVYCRLVTYDVKGSQGNLLIALLGDRKIPM